MSKPNCPACGSLKSEKINYSVKKANRDISNDSPWKDYASPFSPRYVCTDCGQLFGGKNAFFSDKTRQIKSFKFYMGKALSTSHYMMFDAKSMKMEYAWSGSGLLFDFKTRKQFISKKVQPNTWYKHTVWDEQTWRSFLSALEACNIDCWAKTYHDENRREGIQWQVKLEISRQQAIASYGYNRFPPGWDRFLKVMRKYVSTSIKTE